MRIKRYGYRIIAATTALICAFGGPLGAGTVFAGETQKKEQSWKEEAGAGEAIAQENIIKILSVEDLEAMGRQCSLDQWSAGKYVILEANLDLTGSKFECIPTFGGVFDGNGHTVSGFSMTKSGDVNGFFRYIQEGATVKNLTVAGEVAPDGHRDVTGGLVGNNKGMLSNCKFTGTVKGKNRTGGIAGINEARGQIYNCSFEGDVTGEHYAGGIAGENLGSLVRCQNRGTVNITEVKVSTEISGIGLENLGQLNSASNMPASTDVGGIVGVSSGIVQSCENTGDIGYPHTGYNVGGIVGRQSGYLDSCINRGTINGRKDVGGIVGQFEPEVTLQFEPGMLEDLFTELEVLQGMIDTTIQDAKGVSSSISGNMQGLSDSTKNVKSATKGLSDSMIDWADENLEAINDFSARLSWAIDQMVPAANAMTNSMASMGDAAGLLSDALKEGKIMMEAGSSAMDGASGALEKFGATLQNAKNAADHINDALKRLGSALGDDEEMQKMIHELGTAFKDLGSALEDVAEEIRGLKDLAGSDAEKERLERMAQACESLGRALQKLGALLEETTVVNGSLSGSQELAEAADSVAQAGEELQAASGAAAFESEAEQGSGLQTQAAHAQVQGKMADLGRMLDEVSALFEEWEGAGREGSKAATIKAALLEKLERLQEKAGEVDSALADLKETADREGADSNMDGAVEEACSQLEQVRQTAQELTERLQEAQTETEGEGEIAEEERAEEERAEEEESIPEEAESMASEAEELPPVSETSPEATESTPASETPAEATESTPASETPAEAMESTPASETSTEAGVNDDSEVPEEKETAGVYYTRLNVIEAAPVPETEPSSEPESSPVPEPSQEPESEPGSTESETVDWDAVLEDVKKDWEDAEKDMKAAFENLFDSMKIIGDSLGELQEAGQHGTNAVGILSRASSKMKDGLYSLSQAAGGIRDTLSGLAQQPAVQFTPLDSKITAHKDALDLAMDDMTAQLEQLNNTMTVSSDVMLKDMEAINGQFGVIIRVLKQGSEKENDTLEDRIVDVSDEENIKEESEGCVTGSVNEGEINGDVNVAGIVGSMAIEYDFDPEDDLKRAGEISADFSWLTSAVLSDCKNVGEIIGKKDCAGGIVGCMDMGIVTGCESYGPVKSSSGNYVGGIAGASYATIRDSWAKCSLSGADYVGGIAGLGSTITNCHSLVELTENEAFAGSIAGKIEEDGELAGNTYVHKDLAAVDGISYAGKAEPVPYDVLLSGSGTPEKFREFELTFTADGEVVSVMKFQYGRGIKSLPEIPAKEGYSAKWPDLDYSCLTFSQTVEAEYTAYESALSAGGEIPTLLVDGSFSSEAGIEDETQELTFTDAKGKEHTGTAVTVRVKDPVLEEVSYTVHYKLPEDGKRYRLWVLGQNGWEKQDYETDGDYLLLKNEGEEVTFLLEGYRIPWEIPAAAAVVAIPLIVLTAKRKKKKNK